MPGRLNLGYYRQLFWAIFVSQVVEVIPEIKLYRGCVESCVNQYLHAYRHQYGQGSNYI
jgi:hypothetical protein